MCSDNAKTQGCNTAVRFNYNNQMACLLVKCEPLGQCKWQRTPDEPDNVAALISCASGVDQATATPEPATVTPEPQTTVSEIPTTQGTHEATTQAIELTTQIPVDQKTFNVPIGLGTAAGGSEDGNHAAVPVANGFGNVVDPFAQPQNPSTAGQAQGPFQVPPTTGSPPQVSNNPIVQAPVVPNSQFAPVSNQAPAQPATQGSAQANQVNPDPFAQPAQNTESNTFANPAVPANTAVATNPNQAFANPATDPNVAVQGAVNTAAVANSPFGSTDNSNAPIGTSQSAGGLPPASNPVQQTDIWGRPIPQQVKTTTESYTPETTTNEEDADDDDEWMSDDDWDAWLKTQEAKWNDSEYTEDDDEYEDDEEEDEEDDDNYYNNNNNVQAGQLYPSVQGTGTGTKLQSANVHRPSDTGSSFLKSKDFMSYQNVNRPIIIAGLCSLVVMVVLVLFFIARKMCRDQDRSKYRPLRDDAFSDHQYHDHPASEDPEWK